MPPGKGVLVVSWFLAHLNSSTRSRGAPDPGVAGWSENLSSCLGDCSPPLLSSMSTCTSVPTSSLSPLPLAPRSPLIKFCLSSGIAAPRLRRPRCGSPTCFPPLLTASLIPFLLLSLFASMHVACLPCLDQTWGGCFSGPWWLSAAPLRMLHAKGSGVSGLAAPHTHTRPSICHEDLVGQARDGQRGQTQLWRLPAPPPPAATLLQPPEASVLAAPLCHTKPAACPRSIGTAVTNRGNFLRECGVKGQEGQGASGWVTQMAG